MRVGHVAQIDYRVVDLLHRQIVDVLQQNRAGIERDVPVEFADLGVAGRQHKILRRYGVDDVIRRYVVRLHGVLIEVDLGLENFSAVRRGHCGAGNGRKLRADEVLPVVEQLHLRHLLAGERQLQDRNCGRVVAQHIRRGDAGRQQLEHRLRRRGDLRQRGADIDAFLEENFHHAVTVERLRLDVLDVGDLRGQIALIEIDDAPGHVVRQQPGVGPHHADDRNVDVGENVGRRPQRRQGAEDRNKKG